MYCADVETFLQIWLYLGYNHCQVDPNLPLEEDEDEEQEAEDDESPISNHNEPMY